MNTEKNNFSGTIRELFRNLCLMDKNEKGCCGITMPQAYAIEEIKAKPGCTMKELSRKSGVATSTMTRIVNVLERDGLVKRKKGAADRRQVRLELTEKGMRVYNKLNSCYESYIRLIQDKLPEKEKTAIKECLEILNGVIGSVKNMCCE